MMTTSLGVPGMDSWSDYYHRRMTNRQTTFAEEQMLYDHLLERVKIETPEELLARFQMLLINGVSYSDHAIWQALKRIVTSPYAEKDFKFILNRSCHILINHWLMQPRLHHFILELVQRLTAAPTGYSPSQTTKRLRELVRSFQQTEQFMALQRLAQVVGQSPDWTSSTEPLGTLIRRYPCLYEYNLLTEDSTDEQRRRVRQIRRQIQRQFEQDLARYATHRRLEGGFLNSHELSPAHTRSLKNPTLLSDRQLDKALRQFAGKIDGCNTYRDLAQRFVTYSSQAGCYRSFKNDLYAYLLESIESKYIKTQFNQRLYTYMQNILPDYDTQCLNDVLLIGTCRKLLNFLVVESAQAPNHAMFIDLTGNLGIAMTIGLLLKVILICRNVKPYLEKRFAILFRHYESRTKDGVLWLVESLEHLNVALSINFGTLNL